MAVSAARMAARRACNGAFVGFCLLVTAIALVFLAAVIWTLVQKGAGAMSIDIFTMDTPASGSRGGLRNAIVGSIILCGLAMAIALSIGVPAGTWLSEYAGDSRYGSVVRFLNDVLLSSPSILIGLFVWRLLVANVFHRFTTLAGAFALALIALPVIARTTEDVLRLQPAALRESGVALGAPLWAVVCGILWRAARGGMLTGALLAFARISGETAPLLFTALNNQFNNFDIHHPLSSIQQVMGQPIASLPVVMFNNALSAYDDLQRLAWAAALIVSVSVLAVIIIARTLARSRPA